MEADRYAPIGVFDSGVGGLTVVREIMRNLPAERIVYFGDTARVPYGTKSRRPCCATQADCAFSSDTEGEGDCDCL